MKEIIEQIVKVDDDHDLGYKIKTSQQTFSVLIDNGQNCCEVWGFLDTQDNIQDFIGAELISINAIDSCYNLHPKYYPMIDDLTPYKDSSMSEDTYYCFVDINTSKGKLQFTVYNSHNGYYGHDIKIESNQLKYSKTL